MGLIYCHCTKPASKYQEERHGKGVRVGTPKKKKRSEDPQQYACTVCGALTYQEVK